MPEAVSEMAMEGAGDGVNIKVKWVIPQRLGNMTFVGKDVLAVAHDIYIIFFNFKNNSELVYVANNQESGDGVDVIAGHRTSIFAFTEKVSYGRIMVMTYPNFKVLAEMHDKEVNRYKGVCIMENDLVAGFSGFPNYIMTIWNWRTHHRLISVATGVIRREQLYMSSRTHMLVCQCWGEGLIVWEVAQCFKKCFIMKRMKEEVVSWEVSEPSIVGICWSIEGQLYGVDSQANLYSMASDGIGMVSQLEWSAEQRAGGDRPHVCAFGSGLLVYGPDQCIRSLKKVDKGWKVAATLSPHGEVARMVSNGTCDVAAAWTADGLVYRITGESEDKVEMTPMLYKQRKIIRMQMIAPDNNYIATMNDTGVLCIYETSSGKLMLMKHVEGQDILFETSPVEPIIAVFGCRRVSYGMSLFLLEQKAGSVELARVAKIAFTHQIVSRVVFSPTGREMMAAAMSAGHVFIYKLSTDYKLTLVRYTELGRGLADCFLMKVGEAMRCFCLVLFSDKFLIGERIICINAESGKDNKFAGKMQGPYARLLPLQEPDHIAAIPHMSRAYHVCKLAGDKGVTVSVKMGPIIDSAHDVKQVDGGCCGAALLTIGYDGNVIIRPATPADTYDLKLLVSHRYESGVKSACLDTSNEVLAHLSNNQVCAALSLRGEHAEHAREHLDVTLLHDSNVISILTDDDKTYLELQEEKKVHSETMDYRAQREEVVRGFAALRDRVVALLEENIAERPLHQLSLAEFNLHLEHRKERNKLAEREREEIRLSTEAWIRAQDRVTAWIKQHCWDTMLTPRVKLFAIFSHYQVENYPVLPSQRDKWPELNQVEALRLLEMEHDHDLFRPWEEPADLPSGQQSTLQVVETSLQSLGSGGAGAGAAGQPHVLAGSAAHRCVPPPAFMIPQLLASSFLQMNWLHHIVKLTVQNMRLYFNKQFDELMAQKKREVNLVEERNSRLRFIIEELNKLSDLRGSFHHLVIQIRDPEWQQDEQPEKLIKVDPAECSIEPYISPSQVVVVPPDPGPKDDFRERALMDMMDGVLEKLWHEEIKKPIPLPQCMLEKDPEHFNEEDLRYVFDYEAKVAFRNEERDKYRKMLHAEYAKLTQVLNEGVVKFNQKVKEMWLQKLRVDSIIGQENLNLMRLRRTNLDRVEMAEKLEDMRALIHRNEQEVETLTEQQQDIQEQGADCQAAYEQLTLKDRVMERGFKNNFADLSPIIVDQCYKFYKKRPKWQARATLTPAVLYELASAIQSGVRPAMLPQDCVDYCKGLDQLDQVSNMPPVMDEGLWAAMCKLRRAKIENEVRMRGVAVEISYVDSCGAVWQRGAAARRALLARTHQAVSVHREQAQLTARNKTVQLVLPAGQVEIITTGHTEDFEDATLILKEDVEKINNVILAVGDMKLRMMRAQMEFRKGILGKEWQHAQMVLRLLHLRQELASYTRLKIPKELQLYLKNKELGYTEEQEFVRMEKEMEASKTAVNRGLDDQIHKVEELQLKVNQLEKQSSQLEALVARLHVQVSEKRLHEDPLEPIRVRRIFKKRMETLVMRSSLIRSVQANHSTVLRLQTELELLRLRTYPTLAGYRTVT